MAVISSLAIAATYMSHPDDPDYAGSIFAWNIMFYYPIIALSFICWAIALVFYLIFLRQKVGRTWLKIASPPVFLLPFIYEAALIIRSLARLKL